MNSDMRENMGRVNRELSFLAEYRFTAIVQRMSNCNEVQNTVHTPDKVLNVFMHE